MTGLTPAAAEPAAAALARPAPAEPSGRTTVFRRLMSNPAALVGLTITAVFVVVAVAAPLLAPYSPTFIDLANIRPGYIPGPSAHHLLGLDDLGRDELSRLIYGARSSLLIGVVSVSLGAAVGLTLGTLAGGLPGIVDSVIMRLMDVMLAIPGLLFAIGVAALLGPSLKSVMIAIGVVNIPIYTRLLRGSMQTERNKEYVTAARSVGLAQGRIVAVHVLPNSLSPVVVQVALSLATAIIDAAGLAFLGLGSANPAVPEWGRMLAETQTYLQADPLLAFLPGIAIVITALGFNLFGEALREALDPKLR
jgi:peptide/nickel transport system permease protein